MKAIMNYSKMKKLSLLICNISLMFFVFLSPVFGQDGETKELVTDRPDMTESATIVPAGSVQLETGMLFGSDSYEDLGIKTTLTNFSLPNNLFRIGIIDRVELRLIILEYGSVKSKVGGTSTDLGKGLSPFTIGTKIKFWDENGALPETALIAHTTLPLGGQDFAPDKMEYDFRFSMAHTLSENLALGYNVGGEYTYNGVDYDASGLYTLSLGVGMSDNAGVFFEFFGDFKDSHSFDAGFTYLLGPLTQLDFSGGFGLTDVAQDYFLSAGITFRWFK